MHADMKLTNIQIANNNNKVDAWTWRSKITMDVLNALSKN